MKKIAVVEGDGIGREVVPVARKVVEVFLPDADYIEVEIGFEKWKRDKTACGDEEIEQLKNSDAILFGAVTTPPDPDYRSVMVQIRKTLDLYSNIRPVKGKNTDIIIVRENTEGLYSGIEWREEDRACTLRVISRKGSTRIARMACRIAGRRKHLTVGHKGNVLKSDTLFRECCIDEAIASGIEFSEEYIDSLCYNILMHPERYDVIVTTNIFGDILSDAAAYLAGGLGMLPSANIGDHNALFEPVHGSAPDIAGKGIANPVAAIRSAGMLLEYLGVAFAPSIIEDAISLAVTDGIATPDLGGKYGTIEFGDKILSYIEKNLN